MQAFPPRAALSSAEELSGLLATPRGYPGEFYVQSVMLDGGIYLHRDRKTDAFEHKLFKRIEAVICNDKTVIGRHAAIEWADAYSEALAA